VFVAEWKFTSSIFLKEQLKNILVNEDNLRSFIIPKVTDFSVVNVHVDELSSARIWQHKMCATFSANVNINDRLPIKVYCRICTLRHIRIEIDHGSQNVF
jgi:hypothetical protein